MRLGMSSALGLASLVGLASMPPLPASGSAFSLFGDMPGVYFDGDPENPPVTYTKEQWDDLQAKLTAAENERNEYKGKHEAAETAKLSEKDQAEQRAKDAEAKVTAAQERVIKAEIKAAVAAAGGKDAEIIALAIRDKIDVKDGEAVEGSVEKAVQQLAKDKPYLFGDEEASTGGGSSNPSRQRNNSPRTFTRAQLRDPAFYRANEKEIQAAAREGRITD